MKPLLLFYLSCSVIAAQVRFSDAFNSFQEAPPLFEDAVDFDDDEALEEKAVLPVQQEEDAPFYTDDAADDDYDYESFDENDHVAPFFFTDQDLVTHQNTLQNSYLKAKKLAPTDHRRLRHDQRKRNRASLSHLLKSGRASIGTRMSQNGRAIEGAVDSLTLYKMQMGRDKPKHPERRRHSSNPATNNNNQNDQNRQSVGSGNPNGGQERTSQQRVVEEPVIEVVGHVQPKPIIFPH